MTTFVEHFTSDGKYHRQILTKGAPEAVEKLLIKVPENYTKSYTYYTKQGYRLLALAYR